MFTVDDLMTLYRDSLDSEKDNHCGKPSYFFASAICLYSSDGTESLHKKFIWTRSGYESVASVHSLVRQNRLGILLADITKYNFLPNFEPGKDSETADVKSDVFRWPTLLGQNVNINLCMWLSSPWKVFESLRTEGILTYEKEL